MKSIVLGAGCFWCIEAVYQHIEGVRRVISGYAGGSTANPSYHKHGDHAEVIRVTYDAKTVTLEQLLEVFFYVHDPTTLNRQMYDVGIAYRSIILCAEDELEIARKAKDDATKLWEDPIVTEIKVLNKFYDAEQEHQDFYNKNPSLGYCQVIINPKIAKFEKKFAHLLKK